MLETIMKQNLLLYAMALFCAAGAAGMLITHLSYRRFIRNTREKKNHLKEKWLELWKTRDRLLMRMNRYVWYPSLLCTALLAAAVYLNSLEPANKGLSLNYLYLGAAIPLLLLLLRQGLDFSYREELLTQSLKEHIEQAKSREVSPPVLERIPKETVKQPSVSPDKKLEAAIQREAVIDQITESIRQTAAAGSHFKDRLTKEEEEIMRDIIREFIA